MAVSEIARPPQPSLAHCTPLSTRMVQSFSVSVALGLKDTTTACKVTCGDARIVLSRTTPNVPPPPVAIGKLYYRLRNAREDIPPRRAKNRSAFWHLLTVLYRPSGV